MAKYAKNRNYIPPSKGKTVLVQPSKDKDGVVKQDWDEYIGHGLNNKHWVLEKSKWSNPFYTPKLSAKICNKRYRRHIKLKTPPRFFERIGRKETWLPMP